MAQLLAGATSMTERGCSLSTKTLNWLEKGGINSNKYTKKPYRMLSTPHVAVAKGQSRISCFEGNASKTFDAGKLAF